MTPKDDTTELCLAHSGVMTQIRIGATVIAVLMGLFSAILGVMWSELGSQNKAIITKINCLASDDELKIIKAKTDLVREKQVEIDTRLGMLERRVK